jgi:hypothetical protein
MSIEIVTTGAALGAEIRGLWSRGFEPMPAKHYLADNVFLIPQSA